MFCPLAIILAFAIIPYTTNVVLAIILAYAIIPFTITVALAIIVTFEVLHCNESVIFL